MELTKEQKRMLKERFLMKEDFCRDLTATCVLGLQDKRIEKCRYCEEFHCPLPRPMHCEEVTEKDWEDFLFSASEEELLEACLCGLAYNFVTAKDKE